MTEGLRSDFMAGMDEIERAADPNSWAASAGPSESTKPEKKHSATMADADATDDADDTEDSDTSDVADAGDDGDADEVDDPADESVASIASDEADNEQTAADPKPVAAATSNGNGNGNGNGSVAGVDSNSPAEVAPVDGDDEGGESA